MSNTNEWVAHGVTTHIQDLQNIPVQSMPWLMERIFKLEVIAITDVSTMPMRE